MTEHEVFQRMRAMMLDADHWVKGQARQHEKVCLAYAWSLSTDLSDVPQRGAGPAGMAAIGRMWRICQTGCLASWNDAPARTWAEIDALIERCLQETAPEGTT